MQKTLNIPRESLIESNLMQPGMTSCQGCGAAISMKLALKALGKRTVVVFPACCFCVFVGGYPHSSLDVPIIHCPFETAAVVASGAAAALDVKGEKDTMVMVWAGDGGTFDIGMQALSGAAERNENILFVCYDNEAYMNTGIQRSSATPQGAWTTTTPAGSIKEEPKKDIEQIMLAHHISYMATASAAYPDDLFRKFQTARRITGMKFIHLLSACPPGWRIDPSNAVKAMRMATQSNVFPIYEVRKWRYSKKKERFEEKWDYTINVRPDKELPVKTYLASQGRFGLITDEMAADVQERVDGKWHDLLAKAEASAHNA
jgi:pyruvate ferredoxin oxidoreductase beta subunit/2-oxoisovalerate ferredoxin oxidoreductase beta subunit